jgi:hypothetical protein
MMEGGLVWGPVPAPMSIGPQPLSSRPAPAGPDWPRRIFIAAWLGIAVVTVVLLVVYAGHPLSLGPSNEVSYVGSEVPTGTNLTFYFSESIALLDLNLTGTSPANVSTILIWGNWTATAPTAVSALIGPVAVSCTQPWGCYGASGTMAGSVALSLNITTDPAQHLGLPQLTIGLGFWSLGKDTVTVTSPLFAVVAR